MRRCDRANRTVKHGGPCKSPFNLPERERKPQLGAPRLTFTKKKASENGSDSRTVRQKKSQIVKIKTHNAMSLFDKLKQQRDENQRLIRQHEDDERRIERLIGENHRLQAAQRQLEYELYFNHN